MHFRRTTILLLAFMITASLFPQSSIYAAQKQPTVQFELKRANNGTLDLQVNYCADINYVWFTSKEIAPAPKPLIHRAERQGVHGCGTVTVANEVQIGDVIEVGIGGSARPPYGLEGTTYYTVQRTNAGLSQQKTNSTPLPPLLITYVRFNWSTNYGGSIVATYCMNAQFHGMRSSEESSPVDLGNWDWGAINGCEGRYAATGVVVGDVILIAISANLDQDPESYDGEYLPFRVKRTKNGLECGVEQPLPGSGTAFTPISCNGFYPQP